MPHVPAYRRYLRFWRTNVDADIDDELRFHFQARTDELRAHGVPAADAERIVAEEFGDVEGTRAGLREIRTRLERHRERLHWWHQLAGDLAYALRGLRATPFFTAGAITTLAVGLGAATLMYGTMRRLLRQPPPHVAAPDQVFKLYFNYQQAQDSTRTFARLSYPFFERLKQRSRTLAAVAAYGPGVELAVGSGTDAQRVTATLVSAGFWRTLGTRPALGRFIADDEAHPATGARVIVLGHAFWHRRFGGDTAVIGKTLSVKSRPYHIIGVTPRGFRGVELTDTDVWLPLFATADGERRPASWHTFAGSSNLAFVIRPAPGGRAAQVVAELSREHALLLDEANRPFANRPHPKTRSNVSLGTLTGALGFDARRIPEATVSVWLVGIAFVLLAIASANVAGLLLLRALRRRREIAVRLALGMSRARLTAMLFVESALVVALGAAASVVTIMWGRAWVHRVLLPGMASESAGIDWHVLGVSAACIVVVALVIGLAPVLQTSGDPSDGLRDGTPHGATRRSRLFAVLLVVQTALSAMLLVGAGLFLRSLHRVTTIDLGMDVERAHVARIDFSGTGRSEPEIMSFFERALARVRAVPGVESASLGTSAPLHTARGGGLRVRPDGEWISSPHGSPFVNYVADEYFDATGMRLVQGRGFTAADRTGPPVTIVNEALAALAWPGRSPLGECAYLSSARNTCARVVGVLRNSHTFRLREEQRLWVYAPLDPADVDERVLLVRTASGVSGLDGTIRRVLRDLDAGLPYVDVQKLGDVLDPQMRPWRLGASVFTVFGTLAALLAALGLYSSLAYAVTQRTREIGVRMALGAQTRGVVSLILEDGLRVAAMGTVVGLALALVAGRWLRDLLFDTSPHDAIVLAAVASTLLTVAIVASLAPARRAARVDPMEALRAD